MAREGRGTPGRVVLKNQPKLTLAHLLRRRKTTLAKFVTELGVTTHGGLQQWCDRMGVVAPTAEEFVHAFPAAAKVNSAREGVVVLEAPPVIDEPTGTPIDPDAPVSQPGVSFTSTVPFLTAIDGPTVATSKKARATKVVSTTEHKKSGTQDD